MYYEFLVNVISTDMRTKTIIINFSEHVKEDSINTNTIQLTDRKTQSPVYYNYEIKEKAVLINLLEWPLPNQEYILRVDEVVSILDEKLERNVVKKISFDSKICSTIEITKPAFNELMTTTTVEWNEQVADETHEKINNYYIEISKESNFYETVITSEVTGRTTIDFPELTSGQYFIRCRAQKDDDYGFWSEVITFTVGLEESDRGEEGEITEQEESIFEGEIQIVDSPKSGETPDSIIIEFDCPIDSDFLDNIIVIRKDF